MKTEIDKGEVMYGKDFSLLDQLPNDWAVRRHLRKRKEVENEARHSSRNRNGNRRVARLVPRLHRRPIV